MLLIQNNSLQIPIKNVSKHPCHRTSCQFSYDLQKRLIRVLLTYFCYSFDNFHRFFASLLYSNSSFRSTMNRIEYFFRYFDISFAKSWGKLNGSKENIVRLSPRYQIWLYEVQWKCSTYVVADISADMNQVID